MWSPWNLTAFLLEIAIIRPKLQKRKQAHRGDMACPWPHSQKVMELRFKAGEFKGQSHLPSFITISCGPKTRQLGQATGRQAWGQRGCVRPAPLREHTHANKDTSECNMGDTQYKCFISLTQDHVQLLYLSHFADGRNETQRGDVTCPRSCGWPELRLA